MFKKGFTIVELIVVVGSIIVIFLGTVVLINPVRRMGEANDVRRWQDIINIAKAIEIYSIENHELPPDFATSTLSVGEKFVLCSSAGVLTCSGQTTSCLVVSDSGFLGTLIADLPVDPQKTATTDTGYYVTRKTNGAIAVGACDTYDNTIVIEQVAKASLPAVVSECGDGFVDSDEVCDDGDVDQEGCGNGAVENGTYCNRFCTAVLTISETCDYNTWAINCSLDGINYANAIGGGYCTQNCLEYIDQCFVPQG